MGSQNNLIEACSDVAVPSVTVSGEEGEARGTSGLAATPTRRVRPAAREGHHPWPHFPHFAGVRGQRKEAIL